MTKNQFRKEVAHFSTSCKYSGHTKTFYLTGVPTNGTFEEMNGMHEFFQDCGFKVIY